MPEHSHPRPRRYYRELRGATKPHLISFDDGNRYIVKFKGNRFGNRILVNEYIADQLAKLLGLSCGDGQVVAVDAFFISKEPKLQGRNLEAGLQFGSTFINDGHDRDNFSEAYIPDLKNRDRLPEVIVFDTFVCNTDRHSGNLLLVFDDPTRKNTSCEFVLIDHSHILGGYEWSEHTLPSLRDNEQLYACVITFDHVQPRMDVFEPFLLKLEALTPDVLKPVVDSIPSEWGITSSERRALLDFLVIRKDRVRNIISKHLSS